MSVGSASLGHTSGVELGDEHDKFYQVKDRETKVTMLYFLRVEEQNAQCEPLEKEDQSEKEILYILVR